MSTAPSLPRGRAWLRALVLLLALLVPGTHAEAHAVQVVAGDIAEYGVLDTAPRPPARGGHQRLEPTPTAPRPAPAPAGPEGRPLPAPPRSPYPLHTLRSVVLRC